jgi:hypothetical protein
MDEQLAELAAVAGAAGAAAVLLARERLALVAGFVVLGAAEGALLWARVPREDLERLTSPRAAAAVVVAVVVALALAAFLVRRPELAPLLLLVAAPFRLPVDVGAQSAFLLLPLYLVLAAAVLALLFRTLRGAEVRALPFVLAAPAAAFVALAALSLLWTLAPERGTVQLLFFLFPGAALLAVVARAPVARWLPRALGIAAVALTSVFALVGLWQAESGNVFFARDIEVANAYAGYTRVTSLFKDPSIYGRHLVLGMAVLLVALWLRRVHVAAAVGLLAVLWAGLFVSYSQSSMVTLAAVTLAVTLALADRRSRTLVVAAVAAAAVVGGAAAAAAAQGHSLREATSGRSLLIENTARVVYRHPIAGVGIGAQPVASFRESDDVRPRRSVSHTTPLTVAAELGVLGLAAYAAFAAAAGWLALRVRRRDVALGVGLAAAFLVLLVHSLFYSGFFEDPLTWGIPALAAAVLRAGGLDETDVARPAPAAVAD